MYPMHKDTAVAYTLAVRLQAAAQVPDMRWYDSLPAVDSPTLHAAFSAQISVNARTLVAEGETRHSTDLFDTQLL